MAYSELIKNFNKIRDYMRDFYVYGFKSRDDYTKKSARSYDDEKRRIESWLGDYMKFHQTADGKNAFLSIDSRVTRHNPLYKAWKTKSFTDRDITLHFIVMDILSNGQELSLGDIAYQEVFRGAIKILNEMEPEKSDTEILCIEKIQESGWIDDNVYLLDSNIKTQTRAVACSNSLRRA